MDFEFSDDQRAMQGEARRVLMEQFGLGAARAALEGDPLPGERMWRQIGDLGWTAIAVPEAYGGLGLGALELCLFAEEMGRVVAPVPFVATAGVAVEALRRYGHADQQARWLPRIAAGEVRAAWLPQPLRLASDRLDGTAAIVVDGAPANLLIAIADTPDGAALCLVDLDQPGIDRTDVSTIDPSRGNGAISFRAAEAEILGDGPDPAACRSIQHAAAIFTAFEQLGGADACLDMARDFVLGREVFGRTLGSYQAIKHKLVDIYVANELARSNAYYGAWALAGHRPELAEAACLSRLAAGKAYGFAAQEMIHVHGGIGFTWETDCHLHLRRAKLLGLQLGSPPLWRDRLLDVVGMARETADAV